MSCSKRSLNPEQKIHKFLNFDSTRNNIRKPHISTLTSRKSKFIALWRSVCLTVFTMQIIFHSKSVNSSSFSFIERRNVSITCVIKLNDCLSFGLITISRRALARRASSIKVSQTFDLSSRKKPSNWKMILSLALVFAVSATNSTQLSPAGWFWTEASHLTFSASQAIPRITEIIHNYDRWVADYGTKYKKVYKLTRSVERARKYVSRTKKVEFRSSDRTSYTVRGQNSNILNVLKVLKQLFTQFQFTWWVKGNKKGCSPRAVEPVELDGLDALLGAFY